MSAREEVDHMTYMVHCHVCPGAWSAEQAGLPKNTDQHPRYVSRMIGSPAWGGLWHCPEHAEPDIGGHGSHGGNPLAACGCPLGDWTDPVATDEQKARWWSHLRRTAYVKYQWACEEENLEAHTFDMWVVHGEPKGPLG